MLLYTYRFYVPTVYVMRGALDGLSGERRNKNHTTLMNNNVFGDGYRSYRRGHAARCRRGAVQHAVVLVVRIAPQVVVVRRGRGIVG